MKKCRVSSVGCRVVRTIAYCLLPIALFGCAQMFSQRTKASYVTSYPDGRKTEVSWDSDQEQTGLNAKFDANGATIKVERAGTMEQVVAATLQSNLLMQQLLQKLSEFIPAAAKAGALAGS